MKKHFYILGLASMALFASCSGSGSSDEKSGDTAEMQNVDTAAHTESAPPANATTPATAPAAENSGGTSVEVGKEGASVQSGGTKVEVTKDKIEFKKK